MLRIYSPEDRIDVDEARTVCLAVRLQRKWSQGQLAIKLRVHRKVVERIEQRAVQTVSMDVWMRLQALARASE